MKSIFKLFCNAILVLVFLIVSFLTPLALAANTDPNIEIINYSKVPTSTLEKWTRVGTSKFSDWQADTLGVIWELGHLVSEGRTDVFPFNKHQVTLSSGDLKTLTSDIKTWITASQCNEDPYRSEENKW